jgi:hypothetical protein
MQVSLRHLFRTTVISAAMALAAGHASAIDFTTTVTAVKIGVDGKMWVGFGNNAAWAPYCLANGQGNRTYVNKDHPDFIYLYGMYMTALAKGRNVYISGVVGNGSAQCDLASFDGSWML